MPQPDIQFYDSTDSVIVTDVAFSGAIPGVPTSPEELHVWNDIGGVVSADTATDVILYVLGRFPGGGSFVADGIELLDQRSVEIRVIGYQGNAVGSVTGWTPVGSGRGFPMSDIPFDSAIEIEVRVNAPASATEQDVEIALRVETSTFEPLEVGNFIGIGNGIALHNGDFGRIELYEVSDVVENPGGVDNQVQLPDLFWWVNGNPAGSISQLLAFSNQDAAPSALLAGEEYWALVSVGSQVNVTKGFKGAAPLADSARPAIPTTGGVEEDVVAWIRVPFSALIDNSLIENEWTKDNFGWTSNGLTFFIHPGIGLVDNSYVRHTSKFQVTLPASAISTIWMTHTGQLAVGSIPPSPRDMKLFEVVTDLSVVTGVTDFRQFLKEFTVELDMAQQSSSSAVNRLDLDDQATWTNPYNRQVNLRREITAVVHDAGSLLTGGSYIWEIEVFDNAGTWTTLFTSSGSSDRRPQIPWDEWVDRDAFPEVASIGPYQTIRARLVQLPTGAGSLTARGATLVLAGAIG